MMKAINQYVSFMGVIMAILSYFSTLTVLHFRTNLILRLNSRCSLAAVSMNNE